METLDRYADSIQSIRDAIYTIRENIEDSFTDFVDGKFKATTLDAHFGEDFQNVIKDIGRGL